jgi:hypothetical protein
MSLRRAITAKCSEAQNMSPRGPIIHLYSIRTHRGSGGEGSDSADNPLALKGYRRALATPSTPADTASTRSATRIRLSCEHSAGSSKWLHTPRDIPATTDFVRSWRLRTVAKQPIGLN